MNRQKKLDFAKIDRLLDEEFAAYQEKLDKQVRQMNEALKHGSAELLSPEDTKELKSLYHKIVKVLHPDLHPNPAKDNVVFARLMDAGKMLFGKVISVELQGTWVKIEIGIWLHE